MTTETNSVLNSVKEAFAPVTEAFTKLQNLEVPEAAREFVKKQAEAAKTRAADVLGHVHGVEAQCLGFGPHCGQLVGRDARLFFSFLLQWLDLFADKATDGLGHHLYVVGDCEIHRLSPASCRFARRHRWSAARRFHPAAERQSARRARARSGRG